MIDELELLLSHPWLICFDNEESDNTDDDTDESKDESTDDSEEKKEPKKEPKKERLFTQDEVDRMVIKRNKKAQAQLKDMEDSYQALLKNTKLSSEERASLEERLEVVQKEMRTEKENIKIEKEKAAKKHALEVETLKSERDKYQNMFQESTIKRAITDAASKNDAHNPEIFIAVLRDKTKLVENPDTKEMEAKIEFHKKNEETGEMEAMMSNVEDYISQMKEDTDRYGGMFKSNITPGIGQGTNPGNFTSDGRIDVSKITTEDYMRIRAEKGRSAFGIER